jgi:hypothetical protein
VGLERPAAGDLGEPARPVDRDRLGLSLHGERRELVERDSPPRGLAGRRIAEDVPLGGLHEAGGEVHDVAHAGVLAPALAPDDPAERPPRRDADGGP